MTWAEFDARVYRWESQNRDKRITRVFFDGDDAATTWSGDHSECDVGHGPACVRLSTGDVIEI